jgi:hypothetical protein
MSIRTTQYQRKPIYVEAIQVTDENFEEVAAWCQGRIMNRDSEKTKFIQVRVVNPQNPQQTKAFIGRWILYSDFYGYKVYTDVAFKNSFVKSELMASNEAKAS